MKFLTWADVVMGVVLLLSPLVLRPLGLGFELAEQIVPGLILLATAGWILLRHRNRLRATWLQAIDGLWVIVGSFLLVFSGLFRAATGQLALGVCVLALSLAASWTLTRQATAIDAVP